MACSTALGAAPTPTPKLGSGGWLAGVGPYAKCACATASLPGLIELLPGITAPLSTASSVVTSDAAGASATGGSGCGSNVLSGPWAFIPPSLASVAVALTRQW